MDLAKIHDKLNSTDRSSWPKLNLAILRNITIESIRPYLEYAACELEMDAQLRFGEIDNIFQEAVGEKSDVVSQSTDAVLLFTYLEGLSWSLARSFSSLSSDAAQMEMDRVVNFVRDVVQGLRKKTNGLILWHTFLEPVFPSGGVLDFQSPTGHRRTIARLNSLVSDALAEIRGVHVVDMNRGLSIHGEKLFLDSRYWHIGRAPFSREALGFIADEDFRIIRASKAKNKKCLVLDADNTLWGGVIGEDGLGKIKLGKNFPGSPYYEFQQEILGLFHRGVLLAICSKNNQSDVIDVLDKHPDMLLRAKHFAAMEINWDDKASNLKKIASTLNIGLDAMVFADDSAFEVSLAQSLVPEVTCLLLPSKRPEEYRRFLADCGLFETLTWSEEDKNRTAMIRADQERKETKTSFSDVPSYLASLEMKIEIRRANNFSIPRIAQLTQKTNQFNLTTKRYTDAEIESLSQRPDYDVVSAALSDKFGDLGLIGVAIIKEQGEKAVIDDFLLSCRALGRGVEDAFLLSLLGTVKSRGAKIVVGHFRATAKNSQAADFYSRMGFRQNGKTGDQEEFHLDLNEFDAKLPCYFQMIDSDFLIRNQETSHG